jgi:uncharacterized phage protein (TIGR01671 family)
MLKFRQFLTNNTFHYWGYLEEGFTGPCALHKSEQFIGINDVNGREIYESDIVKLSHIEDTIVKVVYVPYLLQYVGYTKDRDRGCFLLDEDVEVLGNIHENPELLE